MKKKLALLLVVLIALTMIPVASAEKPTLSAYLKTMAADTSLTYSCKGFNGSQPVSPKFSTYTYSRRSNDAIVVKPSKKGSGYSCLAVPKGVLAELESYKIKYIGLDLGAITVYLDTVKYSDNDSIIIAAVSGAKSKPSGALSAAYSVSIPSSKQAVYALEFKLTKKVDNPQLARRTSTGKWEVVAGSRFTVYQDASNPKATYARCTSFSGLAYGEYALVKG